MNVNRCLVPGAVLAAAGLAMAQPVVDGLKDASFYGPAQWVNATPTSFGNNNYAPPTPCPPTSGAGVTTGMELAVPLSSIGNPTLAQIKIAGFINGSSHDYISNQVIGGIPAQPNLAEPRNINFSLPRFGPAGSPQWITPIASATAPVIDGTLDGNGAYGAPRWTQNVGTGFGDANSGTTGSTNGSELDGAWAVVANDGGVDKLFIFLSGNLETNCNKLEIFIDSKPDTVGPPTVVGQNRVRGDNPAGGLNRMGNTTATNGLTFDAGFNPDYWISVTACGGTNPAINMFIDGSEMLAAGGGMGGYFGTTTTGNLGGALTGGTNLFNVQVDINNSNTAGVDGCQPSPGQRDKATGSELDALYAYRDATYLYLMITGNMESSFNTLNLFFDVKPGGQQQLRNDNVNVDFNGLNRLGSTQFTSPVNPADPNCTGTDPCSNPLCTCQTTVSPGLKFDDGFVPDYFLAYNNGNNPIEQYINAAVLRTACTTDPTPPCAPNVDVLGNALDYSSFDGGVKQNFDPIAFPGDMVDVQADPFLDPMHTHMVLQANAGPRLIGADPYNPGPHIVAGSIRATLDNSNLAGISDTTADSTAALAVTTGLELRIRLDELGWDGVSPIKIAGFIANGGRSVMSNQVLGSLPVGQGNLGEPSNVDFTTIAGNQYITLGSDCDGNGQSDSADIAANPLLDCFNRSAPPIGGLYVRGGPDGQLDKCQCPANWNRGAGINSGNVTAFLNSWFATLQGTIPAGSADINCDGATNSGDVTAFLNLWFSALAGQPPYRNCP